MLQKIQVIRHAFISCLVFFLIVLLINSCKKADSLINSNSTDTKTEIIKEKTVENFFKLPANASSVMQRIANALAKQNMKTGFIKDFIAKEGFPIWNKSRVETRRSIIPSFDSTLVDTVVYIPLVVNADQYVHGFLKATVRDTVDIRIFRQNDYVDFPFKTPTSSTTVTTGENYAIRMMSMDRDVFGTTEFMLKDKRLFHNNTDYSDTAGIQLFIKLAAQGGGGDESFTATTTNYQYQICYDVVVYTNNCGNSFSGSTNNFGVCGWHSHIESLCMMYESNGGSGGWPAPPGGGQGGSGGPSGGGGTECLPGGNNINGFIPIECNPGSGGNPWPSRDANGFLYSRIYELQYKLSQNPFAVEPCDSLNIMPLDPYNGYGAMYQRVAQYSLSQAVISRIDSIIGVTPGYEFDNFNRTNWNDAYGAIINCDFFPVRIAQMPTGYTPESLVEYFRKNTNLFIDSSIGVTFGFYNHGGFNDSVRYNANDTNSTGAVIHIGMENDGSVIQSSYFHDYMSGHERHRFTFSTMRTPLDYAHPVAGNRDFGIYRSTDAAHPNDFCFYTMGVDRVTDWVFASGDILLQELTGLSGFIKADLLWHNVQKNMISFIEGHGGHAGFYATPFIRARPKYADVRDYLSGTISWEILKEKLGC